jgi:hypothetical protein
MSVDQAVGTPRAEEESQESYRSLPLVVNRSIGHFY